MDLIGDDRADVLYPDHQAPAYGRPDRIASIASMDRW